MTVSGRDPAGLVVLDFRPSTADLTYRRPLDDAHRVRDHVSFWNERTDIRVDGETATPTGDAVVTTGSAGIGGRRVAGVRLRAGEA